MPGGFLFEHWFICFGKVNEWQKLFVEIDAGDTEQRCSALLDKIWESHKLRWYGWLLKGLKDISNYNTKQLFWITLAAKSKGLSNTGQDALAKIGFTLQSKVFSNLEAIHLDGQVVLVKQKLQTDPHVWWVDNFNRTYGQTFYKLSAGPMKVLNWTGWAYHALPDYTRELLNLTNQTILPARFQTYKFRNLLKSLLDDLTTHQKTLKWVFTESFCETHQIYNVSLKPYRIGPKVTEEDLKQLGQHKDGLHNFVPVQMLEHNIGSEEGLGNVLKALFQTYQFDSADRYSLCKVDVNIFWRLYLVLKCRSQYSRIN